MFIGVSPFDGAFHAFPSAEYAIFGPDLDHHAAEVEHPVGRSACLTTDFVHGQLRLLPRQAGDPAQCHPQDEGHQEPERQVFGDP
jgi:serine/threonine protein kinase HipA of HipAB toxin-antitoxin module